VRNQQTAASKPKYIDIVRLENYFFFCETVGARRLTALQPFVVQARRAFEEAAARYCRWVLEGQNGRLIGFFEKLKGHLESMPANEVQFYLKVTRAHPPPHHPAPVGLAAARDRCAPGPPTDTLCLLLAAVTATCTLTRPTCAASDPSSTR